MFKGSIAAIVTPMAGGKIDTGRLREHIEWLMEKGTDGIVPCGTTGESATLTHAEHKEVIEIAIKTAKGRIKVIAGTGSNSTAEAIELTRAARDLGADGSLLISPYYNKPTQEGVYRHHMAIADAVDIPQVLYNVPGRTVLDILPETVARLSKHPNIVGIKEATGSIDRARDIMRLCPKDFLLLSGDDASNFALLEVGGMGSISVTANVVPEKVAEVHDLFFAGKREESRKVHESLAELNSILFIETNPIPVKTALAIMGRIKEEFRLPLCEMAPANRAKLEKVVRGYGLA